LAGFTEIFSPLVESFGENAGGKKKVEMGKKMLYIRPLKRAILESI
jgi:hypothetical protein